MVLITLLSATGVGLLLIPLLVFAEIPFSFNPGDVVSASQINANFAALKAEIDDARDDIKTAVPNGTIAAFFLTTCPTGWIAADGTNGTPDLRGMFLRGRNDVGTGTRADGWQDPDGLRALGAAQGDQFRSHTHSYRGAAREDGGGFGNALDLWIGETKDTTPAGGNETRPKNVALTFCMRSF